MESTSRLPKSRVVPQPGVDSTLDAKITQIGHRAPFITTQLPEPTFHTCLSLTKQPSQHSLTLLQMNQLIYA